MHLNKTKAVKAKISNWEYPSQHSKQTGSHLSLLLPSLACDLLGLLPSDLWWVLCMLEHGFGWFSHTPSKPQALHKTHRGSEVEPWSRYCTIEGLTLISWIYRIFSTHISMNKTKGVLSAQILMVKANFEISVLDDSPLFWLVYKL